MTEINEVGEIVFFRRHETRRDMEWMQQGQRDKMSHVRVLQLCWTLVYQERETAYPERNSNQVRIFPYDDCGYPGRLEYRVLFRVCLVLNQIGCL